MPIERSVRECAIERTCSQTCACFPARHDPSSHLQRDPDDGRASLLWASAKIPGHLAWPKRAGAAQLCASSRGRHDLSFDDVRPPDMRSMVGELRCRQQSRDSDRDRAQGNIESMIIGVIVTSLPCQV